MNCPYCGSDEMDDVSISERVPGEHWRCDACRISGPRDVLEGLAARLAERDAAGMFASGRRFEQAFAGVNDAEVDAARAEVERLKSPAVVLAEAERLLVEAGVHGLELYEPPNVTSVDVYTCYRSTFSGASLADAYTKATEAGPTSAPKRRKKGGEHG